MKFYLRRVYLNQGGYDRTGQYWGTGAPLYMYKSEDATVHDHIRASDRSGAINKITAKYPNATFARGVGK